MFEDAGGGVLVKKLAGYHQYHAVNLALQETVTAAGDRGEGRVGVVWHTQGSGKSLTMAFYAGRVVLHPAMENPTLVVITDHAQRRVLRELPADDCCEGGRFQFDTKTIRPISLDSLW